MLLPSPTPMVTLPVSVMTHRRLGRGKINDVRGREAVAK
jgi:hypothetical protein